MRITFLAVTALLSVFGCSAVTFPFNVKAPAWTKVAECTAEGGINMRKAPSTTAPRMVYNEAKIEDYETPLNYLAYWGTKIGGSIKPVLFDSGSVAPIVSEQPGWIELLKQGPQEASNAWVSSKFCKVSEITPITASAKPAQTDFMILKTGSGVEGEYGIYFEGDELNALATFYIGRIADGKLVCPYSFVCDYVDLTYEDNNEPTSFIKDSNATARYRFKLTKQCATPVTQEYGPTYYLDFSKFSDRMINFIINNATPLDNYGPCVVYLYDNIYHLMY